MKCINNKKRLVVPIVTILVLISISMYLFGFVLSSDPEKWLVYAEEDLEEVVSFLSKLEFQEIFIPEYNWRSDEYGYMAVFDNMPAQKIKIEDPNIIDAIDSLFEKGYNSIEKSQSTIEFLKRTWMTDFGCGLAYSIDGTDELNVSFLTKHIPLSKPNWYYYESDYNEWRIHQSSDVK